MSYLNLYNINFNAIYVSKVITYLAIYILQKATILRFGIRKIQTNKPWVETNRDLVNINSKINLLEKSSENIYSNNPRENTKIIANKIENLKNKHKIIVNLLKQDKINKDTEKLENKNFGEASHHLASMFKRKSYIMDNNYLKYKDKEMKFLEAINAHLGDIFQSEKESSNSILMNKVNKFTDKLKVQTQKDIRKKVSPIKIETPMETESENEESIYDEEFKLEEENNDTTVKSAIKRTNPKGAP